MTRRLALSAHPIVAAVRNLQLVREAADSPVPVVFLMAGDALTVGPAVAELHDAGKQVVVHVDLVGGITPDKQGVQFLARTVHPDGIVSTKLHVLQAARKERIQTVLHLFVIDTQAFESGIRHVEDFGPDAIEVMPGLMPRVIADLQAAVKPPLIAAGLIKSYLEVQQAIDAGAVTTVIGDHRLWGLQLE